MRNTVAISILATALAGCSLAPRYVRPMAPVPSSYQGDAVGRLQAADLAWREYFADRRLQRHIEAALSANRDLAVSVAIDAATPVRVGVPRKTGDRAWALAVLDNRLDLALPTPLAAGRHSVTIGVDDPAIVFDALRFDPLPASSPAASSSANAGTQGLSHGH